jgi:hypothetical protein
MGMQAQKSQALLDQIEGELATLLSPAIDGQEMTEGFIHEMQSTQSEGFVVEEKRFLINVQHYLRTASKVLHQGLDETYLHKQAHENPAGLDSAKKQKLLGRMAHWQDEMDSLSERVSQLAREDHPSLQAEKAYISLQQMSAGLHGVSQSIEKYMHELESPDLSPLRAAQPEQVQPSAGHSGLEL